MDVDEVVEIEGEVVQIEDVPERVDDVIEIKDDVIEIDTSGSEYESSLPANSRLRLFRRSAPGYVAFEPGPSRNIREYLRGAIREGQQSSKRRATRCAVCRVTRPTQLRHQQHELATCNCDKRRNRAKRDVDILTFFNEHQMDFEEIKWVYENYIIGRHNEGGTNIEDLEGQVSPQSLLSFEDYTRIIESSETMKAALLKSYERGRLTSNVIQQRRERQNSLSAWQQTENLFSAQQEENSLSDQQERENSLSDQQERENFLSAQQEREIALRAEQDTDDSLFRPQQFRKSAQELSPQELSVDIDDHSTTHDDPLDLSNQNIRRQLTSPEPLTFREAFDGYIREASVLGADCTSAPLQSHTATATRQPNRQQKQHPNRPQERKATKSQYLQSGEELLRLHTQPEPMPLQGNRTAMDSDSSQRLLQPPQQQQVIEESPTQQQISPNIQEQFSSQLQQQLHPNQKQIYPQQLLSQQQISSNLQQQALSQHHSSLHLEQRILPRFQYQSDSYPGQRAFLRPDQQPFLRPDQQLFPRLEQQTFPHLQQQSFQHLPHQLYQRMPPRPQQQPFPQIIGPTTLQGVQSQSLPRLQQPPSQHPQQQSFQQLQQQSLEHLRQQSLQRLQSFYSNRVTQSNNVPIIPVTTSQGRYFPH